ncbi:MAG: DUF4431 domain-containing protein [Hyphomicrobium sp.]|uniref:DUF4431 domain-containing protein n=1 Tax=Hyphomicrobium sp. TaxID=82 RepID=UPI001323898C|nr:DUF4431 domain-containing protein [Hyphomicrobium sp.]KAB2937103.1 MAG: DUF4431 domain-containing protein [Hyphomicrobium sp.]MBZ0210360.1 DUF4431 domain-containing protein [Hyphomicrobium sp.]
MRRVHLAFIILLAGSAPAWACEAKAHLKYNAPVELEGTLKSGQGQHEAQGAFTYSYLELDEPVCVDGADEFNETTQNPVARIQIAGEEASKDLPFGKRVTVAGTLFAAHTMWHAEDVLIDASEVRQR